MSDKQQPEELRPIPDGGLKDTMPGWLKRPPAWRNMPSAEERHERTLPEPDTSEIDPKALVDVSDLPKWLQTIAARGDVPVPEPDQAVGHALVQIQAASARTREVRPDVVEAESDEDVIETTSDENVTNKEPDVDNESATQKPEPSTEQPVVQEQEVAESQPMPIALVLGICAAIVIAIIVAYLLV